MSSAPEQSGRKGKNKVPSVDLGIENTDIPTIANFKTLLAEKEKAERIALLQVTSEAIKTTANVARADYIRKQFRRRNGKSVSFPKNDLNTYVKGEIMKKAEQLEKAMEQVNQIRKKRHEELLELFVILTENAGNFESLHRKLSNLTPFQKKEVIKAFINAIENLKKQ